MRVLIAGGGTGGHLFPGIAVAEELRRRSGQNSVLFVGTARGIETRAVPKAGFALQLLPVSGLRRKGLLGFVRGILRLPLAMVQAVRLVRGFKPDVAVSVGGYAAGPAMLAARLTGVPCFVMEQNAVAGVTNRILGRLARRILAGLPPKNLPAHKVTVVGNPVRRELLAVRDEPYAAHTPMRLLVVGGSQGARALNEAMMVVAPTLSARGCALEILHQTGSADWERVQQAYKDANLKSVEARAFIDDMAAAYRRADLVLCRAGASTMAELTVCGRPSILVPYPFAVDDHQTANARTLAEAGGAIHLPQSDLNVEQLATLLVELAESPSRLASMAQVAHAAGKPDSATTIVDWLEREAGSSSERVSEGNQHV